ncbi:alpha/beta hydrolase [Ignatzschineria rhizosphaerae]|uniref:Alpha/beta hydrolase n=1 Tax=Ignatzschineria rhizosphaerae TaxID=2923279 RepID=A0ABY3X4S8_9GAMM|nr:alpha/beta hydrolase [Ignatzschineria rhizosphaerae]UNM96910.1 alpha/beta hydrolase [Ignatzschineria rhizosphaerae]
MTKIDKDTQNLLDIFKANGGKSFEALSVKKSREAYLQNDSARLDKVSIQTIYDQEITTKDQYKIKLRIYEPREEVSKNNQSAAIIFIHGGGWVVGNLETHDSICRMVSKQTNLPIIAIDYRLAPEFPFPCALSDCLDSLKFIAENTHTLKINPNKLIIMGDSAGGNLATVIAHQFNQMPTYTITSEILFYPVTTMITDNASYQRIAEGYPLSAQTMHWFINKYVTDNTDLYNPQLSPLYNEEINNAIKSFIVTAGLDPLCDEGVLYAKKLICNGNYVEFHHLPNTIHGIITTAKAINLGKQYLSRACDFILEHQQ